MMFYDFNAGYTPEMRRVSFLFLLLRISFTFRLDVGCALLHREKENKGTTGINTPSRVIRSNEAKSGRVLAGHGRFNTHLAEPHIWDTARQTLVVDKTEALHPHFQRGGYHRLSEDEGAQ